MHLMTTNQQFFDKPPKLDTSTFVEQNDQKLKTFAGKTVKAEESAPHGIKQTSPLVGEQFKDSPDPKQNTMVQRAWQYSLPADLKVAEKNLETN